MRLSIRRVTILTLGLLFMCGSVFSALKEKTVVKKKTETTEQASSNTVEKQTPTKGSTQAKEPIQTTTGPTETAPAEVKPVQPPTTPFLAPATTTSRAATYSIDWFVIAAGGGSGASTNYSMNGTVGQTAVGEGSSTNYELNSGFWQNFGPAGCCMLPIRGDMNYDGDDANILDLTFTVDRIFRGGPPPSCDEEGDVNTDGDVCNILDLTFLVDRIFRGGPLPGPC